LSDAIKIKEETPTEEDVGKEAVLKLFLEDYIKEEEVEGLGKCLQVHVSLECFPIFHALPPYTPASGFAHSLKSFEKFP
jgi:hypothetical protein